MRKLGETNRLGVIGGLERSVFRLITAKTPSGFERNEIYISKIPNLEQAIEMMPTLLVVSLSVVVLRSSFKVVKIAEFQQRLPPTTGVVVAPSALQKFELYSRCYSEFWDWVWLIREKAKVQVTKAIVAERFRCAIK